MLSLFQGFIESNTDLFDRLSRILAPFKKINDNWDLKKICRLLIRGVIALRSEIFKIN